MTIVSAMFMIPTFPIRLLLINYNDVLAIYESNIGILSIGLKPGKVAYEFFGFRNDVKKLDEATETDALKNRFRHTCSFVIYEFSQSQKQNIERLSKGRYMAIVENKGKTDDAFELLGRQCGLHLVKGQVRSSENGVFTISLSTPDNGVEFEPRLPQTVGETYDEALDIIDIILGDTPSEEGFDYILDMEFA